jgi:hypothetical protein
MQILKKSYFMKWISSSDLKKINGIHSNNLIASIKEVRRVLKLNGILIFNRVARF